MRQFLVTFTAQSLPIALERVQSVARYVHVVSRLGDFEERKHLLKGIRRLRAYAAPVSLLVKAFQAAMLEANNHESMYCVTLQLSIPTTRYRTIRPKAERDARR